LIARRNITEKDGLMLTREDSSLLVPLMQPRRSLRTLTNSSWTYQNTSQFMGPLL